MITDYGTLRVRPSVPADAVALAPNLRSADLDEIKAGSGSSPLEVLQEGIRVSTECYTAELASGEVVALFGVAPSSEPRFGLVWLLGSHNLTSIRFTFLRHSRKWLTQLFKNYSVLGNVVDVRNKLHVEWLRWLGFRFLPAAPSGRNGEMRMEFLKFTE